MTFSLKSMQHRFIAGFVETVTSAYKITKTVLFITIPMVIIMRILEQYGMIEVLATALEPIMKVLYLPGEAALIWAVSMTSNLYAGLVVFVSLSHEFTVLQATIMASLMLGAHSIFVEMIFVAKTGCRFFLFTTLRIVMTLISTFIMANIMMAMGVGTEPTTIHFIPTAPLEQSWGEWTINTAKQMLAIPIIAFWMVGLLNILKALRVTTLICRILSPVLRPIGIQSQNSSELTLVGVLLGLAFGGALIVEEAKKGHIPDRDIAMIMLSLCNVHAAVEDNALMTLIGAWVFGFVVLRTLICYAMLFVMGRVFYALSDKNFYRFIFVRQKQSMMYV